MPPHFKGADQIIKEGFQQTTSFIPTGKINDPEDTLNSIETYDDYLTFLKKETKLPDDLADTVASATLYGFLEKVGIDPAEWQLTVPLIDRENVKYGVDEFEEARKFLGSWTRIAEIALFIATIAAIIVALVGSGLAAAALITMGAILRKGASKAAMSTLLAVVKLRGIKWLSLPAAVLAIATGWSFFATTQITATGDLTTYIKQGVARGEEQLKKLEAQAALAASGVTTQQVVLPKTIIRMVEERKPEQFIGTLFSAKLGKLEDFSRVVDDEITSEEDLLTDVKLNLNKWLSTLPGRLGYSVVIRKDPVDSFGVKQSGTWATLTLHFTRLSGPIQPIDTILLGPVTPATKLKLTKTLKTVESTIPGILTGQEVVQVNIPSGAVDIFDTKGERVDLSTARLAPAEAPFVTPEIKTPAEQIAAEQAAGVKITPTETPEQQIEAAAAEQIAALAVAPLFPTEKTITNVTRINRSGQIVEITTFSDGSRDEKVVTAASAPAPEPEPTFNVNEFEGGIRGTFIQELGVFENQILRVNTGGGNLNARQAATTDSAILFKIINNATVIVDRYAGTANGFEWAAIRTHPGNKAAFVAFEFLQAL